MGLVDLVKREMNNIKLVKKEDPSFSYLRALFEPFYLTRRMKRNFGETGLVYNDGSYRKLIILDFSRVGLYAIGAGYIGWKALDFINSI